MCKSWFKGMLSQPEYDPGPFAEGIDSEDEKRQRIALLSGDEYKAFEWFRLGYTARWAAETMLLDRKTARHLFRSVFRKLRVTNETEVCKFYNMQQLQPKDIPPEEDGL